MYSVSLSFSFIFEVANKWNWLYGFSEEAWRIQTQAKPMLL